MYLGRKGLTQNVLVSMVVVIVAFIAVYFLAIRQAKTGEEISKDEACRLSVELAAASKKIPSVGEAPGTGRSYVPLNCPRKEILLRYKDVVEDGRLNQDKAHKIIADEMYKCWSKLGEGRLDPFSNWDTTGESYCMICGAIKFDDKLNKFTEENSDRLTDTNFQNYFITNPLPYLASKAIPIGSNKGRTYFEYLWKDRSPQLTEEHLDAIRNSIVLPNSLILVSMYKKDSKTTTFKWVGYGISAGLLLLPAGIVLAPARFGIAALLTRVSLVKTASVMGKILSSSATAKLIGGYTLMSTTGSAFRDCPECNGFGGIVFLSSEDSLNQEIILNIDNEERRVPLCTILVN